MTTTKRPSHAAADHDHGGLVGAVTPAVTARDRAVGRVLWGVLGLNLLVAVTKLAIGVAIGALSLVADGVHSLLDGASNVVGIVGMSMASRPPDANHPYGHRRFETLAAIVIGLLIAAGLAEIVHSIIVGLVDGRTAPAVSWPAAGAVAATIAVNLGISRYERARGKALRSALLTADAGHTFSDALSALAVLGSFAAVALGFAWADLIAAAVVCVFIGRTAWQILATNLGVLADEARLDPNAVREIALGVTDVEGAHMVRSRGSTDWVQLDLHIQLDAAMTVARAHEKTHEVANAIRARFPEVKDVVIHTEPADGHQNQTAVAPEHG